MPSLGPVIGRPATSASVSAVRGPGRSRARPSGITRTIVDSSPSGQGPSSTISAAQHVQLGFELRGAHLRTACTGCHTSGTFVGTTTACASCHEDRRHRGRFGTACERCHDETTWRRTPSFDHAVTGFVLERKHVGVPCARCHGPTGMALVGKPAARECRYRRSVFIAPPWPEIFAGDAERKQDFAEAQRTYEAMLQAYPRFGYALLELPRASIGERVAFSLKAGDTSDVVKTQYGFHIIKVTERQEGERKPFDQVKEQIRATLRNQGLQEQVQGHFDALKKDADLKIDEAALARITPPPPSAGAQTPMMGGH